VSPLLGALLAVVFWGVSFVATKAVVREISPFALILLRAALGSALLRAVMAARRVRLLPPRAFWPMLALMGFVGVAFHQLLQGFGLTLTSAVNTGWLIGLTPIWSALLARVFLGERFSWPKVLGLALGFLGAAIVVTGGRWDGGLFALPSTRGDVLILLSTLNWAVYSVLGRNVIRDLGSTQATAGAMTTGLLMLMPALFFPRATEGLGSLSTGGWVAVLFLGLCCSGLGYLFWYRALEQMEASRVAALLYLEPLVTLGASALLLGEPIRAATVLGGVLLLAGVGIVQRARS
jgi:drug/metabolite transporter (DMT)-like permease